MTSKLKNLVASTSLVALIAQGTPAMAAGTLAGDDVTNNVSVSFNVNGTAQTAAADSDTFKVDRKIIFDLVTTDTAEVGVAPSEIDALLTYTISNTSNDTLDFTISPLDMSGGTAITGTDNIDTVASSLYYCVDNNDNNMCDTATELNVNVNDLAPDSDRTVWVYGDIPTAVSNGNIAGVTVTAVALDSAGAALTNDSGAADIATGAGAVQNVFADTDNNNSEAANSGYIVEAALLTVTKLSRVVSDPVTTAAGGTNPKAIPGAIVEYCIVVSNASTASGTATGVNVSDNLSQVGLTAINYDSTFTPLKNGTSFTGVTCATGGTADAGAYNAGTDTVSATLSDLAPGNTRTLIFRVVVQ